MNKSKATKRKRGRLLAAPTWLGFVPSFMVWVDGAYGPTKRHNELGLAMEEAERLCRKENKPVYVLADAWKCEPTAPPVKWTPSNIKSEKPNSVVSQNSVDALTPEMERKDKFSR